MFYQTFIISLLYGCFWDKKMQNHLNPSFMKEILCSRSVRDQYKLNLNIPRRKHVVFYKFLCKKSFIIFLPVLHWCFIKLTLMTSRRLSNPNITTKTFKNFLIKSMEQNFQSYSIQESNELNLNIQESTGSLRK